MVFEGVDRSLKICACQIHIKFPQQLHTARRALRVIAQAQAGLVPPKNIRSNDHKTVGRVLIGDRANMGIDAPDLLDQNEPWPLLFGGQAEVGVE